MTRPPARAEPLLLSSAPAPRQDRRIALVIVLASLLLFAAVAPFADRALPRVPAFIPIYEAIVVVCNLITAVLLYGQFVLAGSAAMLVLASGYLFSAVIAGTHCLSYPDIFAPQGIIGGGTQTTAWLYMFWHLGFPLFVIGYALLEPRSGVAEIRIEARRLASAAGAAAALALAVAATTLAVRGESLLPAIMVGNHYSGAMLSVVLLSSSSSLLAPLFLMRTSPRTVLGLWLMVVMFAWTLDIGLSAVFNAARYDLGFYAGRIYGLLATTSVLIRLLIEDLRLYGRLLEAYGKERHNADEAQRLARQLESANALLTEKNRQLDEASQQKSAFLSNMSHELRTPLNAIIGFAEMMKDGLVGEMSPKQTAFAGHVFESGQHLLALINDILDLSKIEAGYFELSIDEVDLNRSLAESLAAIAARAAAKRIDLRADGAAVAEPMLADRRRVRQILDNLLNNAIKFTPADGQVKVTVRFVDRAEAAAPLPASTLGVRAPLPESKFERFAEIAVEDTGIGLAPEDMGRLFTPFMQVDNSTTRHSEGTGLGLAMVRRLAELHGGAVAVASAAGRGSRFTVWLPLRVPAAAALRAPSARDAGRLALVIEDDAKAATLMRLQLETSGFRVRHVASAEAALALAGELRPDLITLDIILPGIDGWQFLERLEKVPQWAGVPIVVVSVAADVGKGFSLGASLVLQKPVGRDALIDGLRRLGLPEVARGKASVLVIDDDPLAIELMASHLTQAGHVALRAHGGVEGIELARRFRPDAIALDLEMPALDGFAVVEELKSSPSTARIPIIVVSARQLSADDRRLLNGHILDIVRKHDFNHGRFIGEVERAMGTRMH